MRIGLSILFVFAAGVTAAGRCSAQEFRIYTRVYDDSAAAATEDGKSPLVATTLTLFHAGRVYDYIPSLNEVIVYEPKKNEFTILNPTRGVATVVHVDEIKRLMRKTHGITEDKIAALRKQGPAGSSTAADMLAFQLAPKFREVFDHDKKTLSLRSHYLRYDARLEYVEMPEYAQAYRQYADWIGRLNFVLNPPLLLPDPRLRLNEKLHAKQALPVEVVLRANTRPEIHVRAQHLIQWSLNQRDRDLIREWNAKLRARATRNVTLQDYRQMRNSESVSRR